MELDFHTHGKLAKKLPFSREYTQWLFSEARQSGLDAICLTEHFNTLGFSSLYSYIRENAVMEGDTLLFEGLRIFPGMETDIAEGGHVLSIGPIDAILELNQRLEPYKEKGKFLPFKKLRDLFDQYPVIVGGAHPFRSGGHIPQLEDTQLERFDFFDLNGKDLAENRQLTERKTYALGVERHRPVVGGSDTHQAVQYGCIRTHFPEDICRTDILLQEMQKGNYAIHIAKEVVFQVKTAGILKRALKEIHALNGDYVSVLIGDDRSFIEFSQKKKKGMKKYVSEVSCSAG